MQCVCLLFRIYACVVNPNKQQPRSRENIPKHKALQWYEVSRLSWWFWTSKVWDVQLNPSVLRSAYLDGVTGSLLLSSKNTLLTCVPLKLIENTRVHLTRGQESFQNVTPKKNNDFPAINLHVQEKITHLVRWFSHYSPFFMWISSLTPCLMILEGICGHLMFPNFPNKPCI